MADLRITDLPTLPEAAVAAGDYLPIADVSASETKKVSTKDLVEAGVTLIDNGSIPASKLAGISPALLGTSSAAAQFIAGPTATTGSFTARTIAPGDLPLATVTTAGAVIVGTGLSVSSGTLSAAIATSATRGAISVPTTSGLAVDGSGVLSHVSSVTAQTKNGFTINATGHITAVGSIAATDLPPATATDLGGVSIGSGLSVTQGGQLNHAATIAAGTTSGITYNATGHITAVTALTGTDLPSATTSTKGAVSVPAGALSVSGAGALTHNDSGVVAGSYAKVTVDSKGHVTAGGTLSASDIPELSAAKLTSGTISTSLFGTKSVTGAKLADYSTVQFGGAGSTSGIVTFPTPEFAGQYFFDKTNGDLYIWDSNSWQPITVISGDLVYAGTYDASLNKVKSTTTQGAAAGLVAGSALPAASATNLRYYVVVSDSGNGTAPAPAAALAPPDMIVSNGATWDLIDVSNAIAGQTASNISFTPYGGLVATNVQTALQELDDEKLAKTGGVITGELTIGATGALAFEGSTDNAYETYLSAVDPTADRTITFPDASGTVVLSGAIVNNDISASAAIADSKLATISTAGKVANSATTGTASNTANTLVLRDASGNFTAATITATTFSGSGASLTNLPAGQLTGTIPSGVLNNSTIYVGTTAVALNRASANQALTGITSLALPGSTSGTVTITPASVAGTTAITLPATSGTLVTTGDTGTVTSTMLANGTIVNEDVNASAAIAGTKVSPDFGAQNVTTTGTSTAASFIPSSSTVPSNGVYLPAANSVGISTNGAGRLFVDASGNVNIGSSLSLPTVSVGTRSVIIYPPSGGSPELVLFNLDANDSSFSHLTFGGVRTNTGACARISANRRGEVVFANNDAASGVNTVSERLRITSAGLVGIGTSSPAGTLHVNGQTYIQGTVSGGQANSTLIANSSGQAQFWALGADTSTTGSMVFVVARSNLSSSLQAVTIDSSGRVGIGTTSPATNLDLFATDCKLRIRDIGQTNGLEIYQQNSDGGSRIFAANNNYIALGTNNTERARIDSSGRLLVGTSTSPSAGALTQYANFVARGNTGGANFAGIITVGRGETAANITSGEEIGYITFSDLSGNEFGTIACVADANAGTNDYPGRLVFSTTADGASSPTERMRITNAGRIGLGQTAPATTVDVNGAYAQNIVAVAALDIDCSTANFFTKTINANSTFTVSNVPASRSYTFVLELTHTSGTITWFSGVIWPGGTAPTLTTGKVHLFMFQTDNGGTTWRASSLINYAS